MFQWANQNLKDISDYHGLGCIVFLTVVQDPGFLDRLDYTFNFEFF